jgi:hypothetical protein
VQLTVSDATVTALQVTPAAGTTAVGLALPLIATAVLSDGTSQVVTDIVSWSSGDSAIATVSNEQEHGGQAKGVSAGTTTITAAGTFNGQPIAGSAQLRVSSATVTSLQLTPSRLRAPIGLPQQYSATAMLSDGSSQPVLDASWHSSDPGMATVSAAGLATGASAGTVTLNASTTLNGQLFSGNVQLTVTDATVTALQVTPTRGSVPIGLTQQYDATALMSDGTSLPMTTSASWLGDPLIATITPSGQATGLGVGTTDISATAVVNGVSVSNSASLTVTGAEVTSLEVSPGIETVSAGLSKPFSVRAWLSDGTSQEVTGNDNISWSSSDSGVATVDGTSGLATGVALGSAYISAAGRVNGRFLSDSASLTVGDAAVMGVVVTPDPATVPAGLNVQLTATAQLSDNSTQDITDTASWGSDATGVATVIGGLATGVSVGDASITATDMVSGQSGSAALAVTDAVVISLEVTPETAAFRWGTTQQYNAIATMSDGSTQDVTTSVSWMGDNCADFFGPPGLATGMGTCTEPIHATMQDGSGISDTAVAEVLYVTTVDVFPAKPDGRPRSGTTFSMPAGAEMRFITHGTLSNGSVIDISEDPRLTWVPGPGLETSSPNVARGIVMGVSNGTTQMQSSYDETGTSGGNDRFVDSVPLTVRGNLITIGNKIFVPPLSTAEGDSLGMWYRPGAIDASTGLSHLTYWYVEAGSFCNVQTGWNLTLATLDELRELYGTLGDMTAHGWPISYQYWGNGGGATTKNLATGAESGWSTTVQSYGACVRMQP